MHYLAKEISDHAPFVWTTAPRQLASKGTFSARPEWIKHPHFLDVSSKMAEPVDCELLTLEQHFF